MNRIKDFFDTERGFTLIELLVAMGISVILFAATYSAYVAYESQVGKGRQTITNREDARAVLHMMATEIQMAGFAPQGKTATPCVSRPAGLAVPDLVSTPAVANATPEVFLAATPTALRFKMDTNAEFTDLYTVACGSCVARGPAQGTAGRPGDTDCLDANELILYTYDAPNQRITRNPGTGAQPLLDNVTALSFQYWCATSPSTAPEGPVTAYGTGLCTAGMLIVQVDISLTVQNVSVAPLTTGTAYGTPGARPTQTFTTSVIPRNMFVL